MTCDVLHLVWSGRIGGIERAVATIAHHGSARGRLAHRVCFLDGRGSVGDALVADGLADRLGLQGGWDLPGLWRLARLVRRLRPRVLHVQTHALGPILVARAALPGAALVYTEQSPRALAPDRKFRLLYALLRRSCDRFVATAPSLARAMEQAGADPARLAVVPNPLPIELRQAPPVRRGEGATVGVVARLEPQKRIDLFLEVLAELRRRGATCSGLVVGDGSRRAALAARCHALGLEGCVELAGEQEDVVPWLDRMDVFLVTSKSEPFGIAAAEAMARGVPVVAMPCPGGLRDLAARGGLLLPDREVAAAAAAVARLLDSPEERARLGARGRAVAEEHVPERVVARLEELYREIAEP